MIGNSLDIDPVNARGVHRMNHIWRGSDSANNLKVKKPSGNSLAAAHMVNGMLGPPSLLGSSTRSCLMTCVTFCCLICVRSPVDGRWIVSGQ